MKERRGHSRDNGSRPKAACTRTGCGTTIRRRGGILRPIRWGWSMGRRSTTMCDKTRDGTSIRGGEVCTYYTLPGGNTGIRCTGGSTYNPSGDSSSRRSTENVREDWPEYDACVAECLEGEPMTKLSSWHPISESTRAQCGIVSALAGKALKLPRPLGKVTTLGCRRSLCVSVLRKALWGQLDGLKFHGSRSSRWLCG